MDTNNLTLTVAYLAGITSFFSPCLVPLLPSYFSIITGFTFKELYGLNFKDIRIRVFLSSVFFVAGFSIVFSLLGATSSLVGKFIQTNLNIIIRFSGLFLIFLGLVQLGVINSEKLQFDYAWNIQKRLARLGYLSAFITGIACALIWIPCVGQILGAMLIFASQTETAAKGTLLLLVFSFGLGTPFILLGLFFPTIYPFLQERRKLFFYLTRSAGVLLIIFGVILLINQYQFYLYTIKKLIPAFE